MTSAGNRAYRHLRVHLRIYAAAVALFLTVNFVAADGLRLVWVILLWGFIVFLHYMYVKSATIDDRWAKRRARDVTEKAYDAGHIEDIRKRYRNDTSA